jgi:hypothetical protein
MWSLNWSENNLQREAAWQIVSTIVNKRIEGELVYYRWTAHLHRPLRVPDISKFVTDMQTFWYQQIADTSVSLERRQHALRTWFWVSRFYVQFNQTRT